MFLLRICILTFGFLAAALGLGAAGLAILGKYYSGTARWYFNWDPQVRMNLGRRALGERDPAAAERIAMALEASGDTESAALLRAEVMFHRAEPLAKADRLAEAAPLLLQAVHELENIKSLGRLRLEAVALSGRCALYLGAARQAEIAFQSVLSQDADHVDAHRGLASLYFDQGALARALRHLEKVAKLDPDDGRPHRLMGLIYQDLKRYDLAAEAYRRSLCRDARGQDVSAVRMELARSLIKQARFSDGLEEIERIEAQADDRPALDALRAEALIALGKTKEAQAILDLALKICSDNPELYRLRGQINLQANRPQEAVSLLERAVLLDPNNLGSRQELAITYRSLGRNALAAQQERCQEEIQKNLRILAELNEEANSKPWDAGVREKMARVCDQLGRVNEAAMWHRAALACSQSPLPVR